MRITRSIVRDRTVSRAEAMDGPRTKVSSHVGALRTAPLCQSRQWFTLPSLVASGMRMRDWLPTMLTAIMLRGILGLLDMSQ
jgi:hypothetical protein